LLFYQAFLDKSTDSRDQDGLSPEPGCSPHLIQCRRWGYFIYHRRDPTDRIPAPIFRKFMKLTFESRHAIKVSQRPLGIYLACEGKKTALLKGSSSHNPVESSFYPSQ
jgi:hypothetical protein